MGGLLRRTMRGSVGVLAVLFCVLCFVVPAKAFAADVPTASYDASTHEATISHAGENGDLFANFKGLMPGDERDQDVNVQQCAEDCSRVCAGVRQRCFRKCAG